MAVGMSNPAQMQADAVKIAGGHTFFLARDIKPNPKIAAG